MNIWPGDIFSSKPSKVEAPPPLPKRTDPSVENARKKAQLDASRRRGRRATILTGGQGVTDVANVDQPQAKTKLGS